MELVLVDYSPENQEQVDNWEQLEEELELWEIFAPEEPEEEIV